MWSKENNIAVSSFYHKVQLLGTLNDYDRKADLIDALEIVGAATLINVKPN